MKSWWQMLTSQSQCEPVLVVGRKNSGKTAYLRFQLQRIQQKGLKPGGFLSIGHLRKGYKQEYYLFDILTQQQRLLASMVKFKEGTIRYGAYYFDPITFSWGSQILKNSLNCDLNFFDEFGPLENAGKGFRNDLIFLLKNYKGILLLSVRPSLKDQLINLLKAY